MFWLLLGLGVLLCLVVLGLALFALWRRVKVLGSQVALATEAVDSASRHVESVKATGPLALHPCPTCGTPVRASALRSSAVRG